MNEFDCIVLGAGLAGSGAAAALARLGWHVLLIEKRRGPQHKVCGEFLSPESQSSLQALGLHAAVATLEPSEMGEALLVGRAGARLRTTLPGTAWGVSRLALDEALIRGAERAGATLWLGATVLAAERAGDGWRVRLGASAGDEREVSARAVIGAFGRHAAAALRPAPDNGAGRRTSYVGVKCHYSGLRLPPEVQLYLFDGGYAGLSPVEDGRANLCLLASKQAFARAGGGARAMLDAVARWNGALATALAGGEPVEGSEVAVAPVDTGRPATPWQGFARVGDAATMIPPLCGDGMAMALRAAELCAPLAHDFLRGHTSLATLGSALPRRLARRLRQARTHGPHVPAPARHAAAGRRAPAGGRGGAGRGALLRQSDAQLTRLLPLPHHSKLYKLKISGYLRGEAAAAICGQLRLRNLLQFLK